MRPWRSLSTVAAVAIVVDRSRPAPRTPTRRVDRPRRHRLEHPRRPTDRHPPRPRTYADGFPVRADNRIRGRDHGRRGLARGRHRRHRHQGRRDRLLRRQRCTGTSPSTVPSPIRRRHRDLPQRRRRLHGRVLRRRRPRVPSDHGVAIVEIIKDMAPGAEIFIARALTSPTTRRHRLVRGGRRHGHQPLARQPLRRTRRRSRRHRQRRRVRRSSRGMAWVNSAGNGGTEPLLPACGPTCR